MADKNFSGIVVHGTFAKCESNPFQGDGGTVNMTTITVHDAVGMAYITVNALNDDATLALNACSRLNAGEPIALKVKQTKSGKLAYVGVL